MKRLLLALFVALGLTPIFATSAAAAPVDGSSCSSWIAPIIDVSSYQPSIPWAAVANEAKGVYVKATEGTWYTSPTYGDQKAGASNAGLPVGAYDFARPGLTNAVQEADFFLAHSGAGVLTLPPMLDLETTTLSPADTAVWVDWWVFEVHRVTGKNPIIYAGGYFAGASDPSLPNYGPLWVAAYGLGYTTPIFNSACAVPQPSSTGPWSAWSGWQYTSVGQLGFGNVDLSAFTPSWWANATGSNGLYWGAGSIGPKVIYIQQVVSFWVSPITVDGFYGPATEQAVMKMQAKLGVAQDGVWGISTQLAFDAFVAPRVTVQPKPAPTSLEQHCRTVLILRGQTRPCVGLLQTKLQARGFPIAADNHFGKQTAQAAVAWESLNHLNPSLFGFGPGKWKVLLG